jgi:hypothetical protein
MAIGAMHVPSITNRKPKKRATSFLKGHKETATMSSEASIPEPPTIFIYNEDTKDDIPNNVTHVKVDPSVKEINSNAFEGCMSLVEVEFSEGLEVIGNQAFWMRTKLKHINKLPSTLKDIDGYAFYCCASLDSIEFSEGLQVIEESAFVHCQLKTIKIPSAHVVIESNAFFYCFSLVSVELPEGLQVIGRCCFFECTSLTTANVPSSVKRFKAAPLPVVEVLSLWTFRRGFNPLVIARLQVANHWQLFISLPQFARLALLFF